MITRFYQIKLIGPTYLLHSIHTLFFMYAYIVPETPSSQVSLHSFQMQF